MCDISIKTKLRTKTVYKVVFKEKGKYYGLFSGALIKRGIVSKRHRPNGKGITGSYTKNQRFYNELMIGRVSGFQHRHVAVKLADYESDCFCTCVLKVTLSGSIFKGTSADISAVVPDKEPTFAGTIVLNFKEV